ncbi:MAG: TadE/TadG family type IV pilus assembly protein [Pseudomonadota bacterium]
MFNRIKSWFIKDKGTAAIEFALVGLPFIVMLIGIVEVSLYFASGVVLEGAANDAARMIRTGQVQAAADPLQTFTDKLCDRVGLLISCINLQYEVLAVPDNSFASAAALTPTFDEDGDLVSGGFTPSGSSDAVLVRIVYRYEFLTPLLGGMMSRDPTTNLATLMSTVVLRNEPYAFGG